MSRPHRLSDVGPVTVYAIHDPSEVSQRVYIGITTRLTRRLVEHLLPGELRKQTIKSRWLASVIKRGTRPEMVTLEIVPAGGDYVEAEQFWIASFRSIGMSLANQNDGGDGSFGLRHTEETRRKISIASTGNRISEEAQKRRTASWRRTWEAKSPEQRRRPSQDIDARFDSLWVPEPNTGCWLWLGGKTFKPSELTIDPARFSYQRKHGSAPRIVFRGSRCVAGCVNPDHMTTERLACNRGHVYTEKTIGHSPSYRGKQCKICSLENTRRYRKGGQ